MEIGPYTLERELARGGQGVVYLARDRRVERQVVLKLLELTDEGPRRRLVREARTMGRLRHPHVVSLHDLGDLRGQPYLVLPYVPGDSLQDRLEREGPLPLAEALALADQLADALQAVHAAGLVHRDLKPANVLLDEAGRALLTDFGLVKDLGPGGAETLSLSVRGGCLGTPGYWPPEQARGRHDELGPAADVYALGATLYALLTGQPPRDASSLPAALDAVTAAVVPPSQLRDEVPRWLDALILGCLELRPDRRPTLEAVRRALRERRFGAPTRRLALGALALGVAAAAAAATAWIASTLPAEAPLPEAPPLVATEPPAPAPAVERLDPLALEARLEEHRRAGWTVLQAPGLPLPQLRAHYAERLVLERALAPLAFQRLAARDRPSAELLEQVRETDLFRQFLLGLSDEGQAYLYTGVEFVRRATPEEQRVGCAALIQAHALGELRARHELARFWRFTGALERRFFQALCVELARAGDEASYTDACREALKPLTLTDDPRWLALHRERLVSVAAIRDEELGPEPWVLIRLGVAVARAYLVADTYPLDVAAARHQLETLRTLSDQLAPVGEEKVTQVELQLAERVSTELRARLDAN